MAIPYLMVKSLGTAASKGLKQAAAKTTAGSQKLMQALVKDQYVIGSVVKGKAKSRGFIGSPWMAHFLPEKGTITIGRGSTAGIIGFEKKTAEPIIKRLKMGFDGWKTITKRTLDSKLTYGSRTNGSIRTFENVAGDKITYGYQMLNHGASPAGIYAQTDRNGKVLKVWERVGNVNKDLPIDAMDFKQFMVHLGVK